MFPFIDFSNMTMPSMDFLIDQTYLSLLSQPFVGLSPNLALASGSDSGISSAETSPNSGISLNVPNIPKTVPGPVRRKRHHETLNTPKAPGSVRNKRSRKEFCNLCQKNITPEGKRSQGPGRHILQYHLCRPLFFCPHCPATSNYDKAHISTHMDRMHKGLGGEVKAAEKHTFAEEYNHWDKLCFGNVSESTETGKTQEETEEKPELEIKVEIDDKENVLDEEPTLKKPKLEIKAIIHDKNNLVKEPLPPRQHSPILFSIDRILSDKPWNS